MTKEKRKEIKETFKALEEVLLQTDSVESIVTALKFRELVSKAKTFSSELRQEVLPGNPVYDFRNDIDDAIVEIEACMDIVGDEDNLETLQEFLCKAKSHLHIVNSCLKGW